MISGKELEPCCCCRCFHQYPALPDYYKFILITILIVMTLIEAIRLFLGYAGNLQEKVVHHSHKHGRCSKQKSASQEVVTPVMCVFVEGARVGWILAAEHPAAVSSHPVSAVQRSHSHTAPGEGRSHCSHHVHTHTGTICFFPSKLTVVVLPLTILVLHML